MKNSQNIHGKSSKRNLLAVILTFSILLCSCESMVNDLDEGKLPKTEAKLVVESYISPQSDEISVKVTKSQPLFGPSTYSPTVVKNAIVVISDGTHEMRIAYNDSLTTYVGKTDQFKIEAGKTYSLSVTDGERSVKAVCTVPPKNVQVKTFSIDTLARNRYPGDTVLRIRMSWVDLKGEANYYSTRGYVVMEDTYYGYDPVTGKPALLKNTNRIKLDYGTDSGIQNDTNLDGITFNSPVYEIAMNNFTITYTDPLGNRFTYNTNPTLKALRFEILNMDENYYKFARSIRESNNNDNPFVEPSLVYTNITGGLGCFGAYNTGVLSASY